MGSLFLVIQRAVLVLFLCSLFPFARVLGPLLQLSSVTTLSSDRLRPVESAANLPACFQVYPALFAAVWDELGQKLER